jgi:hypothetical protein
VETGKADWARWGMQRGGGSTEEAQGMGRGAARRGRGAVGDRRWRGGVWWADRNDDAGGNDGVSIRARGQDERIGSLGERRVRE